MAFSYNPNLLTGLDRARHSVGDTDAGNPLRQDETIAALLAKFGEAEGTAQLAEGLAAQFAQAPTSFGDNGTTIAWGERIRTWLELATRLRTSGGGNTAGSFVANGGDLCESEYVRECGTWWTR